MTFHSTIKRPHPKKNQDDAFYITEPRIIRRNAKSKIKHEVRLTTLIISIGCMTQVASIPEAPPLTNGLTVGQTPADLGFSSPISILQIGNLNRERE